MDPSKEIDGINSMECDVDQPIGERVDELLELFCLFRKFFTASLANKRVEAPVLHLHKLARLGTTALAVLLDPQLLREYHKRYMEVMSDDREHAIIGTNTKRVTNNIHLLFKLAIETEMLKAVENAAREAEEELTRVDGRGAPARAFLVRTKRLLR